MSAGSLHHKSRRSHRNRQQCQRWGDTKGREGRQRGEEEGLAKKDTERGHRGESECGGTARRVNPPLTLSVQTLVNRPLSVPAERVLTEPWKHRGMDQLCCKPHTTADKGCTEGGDQLSFAQTGLRLQKKTFLVTALGNSFYGCMEEKRFS